MRKHLIGLLPLCLALAAQAEESLVDKVGRTVKKGGEAAEAGIEKGASAAGRGIEKGFSTANEKVFKPADGWIQDKVGNKGKTEKPADK